jgi:hypothetical protein
MRYDAPLMVTAGDPEASPQTFTAAVAAQDDFALTACIW